ncbi:MAG: aminotransferase class IV [Pseudomonadota bacterium]
MSPARNQRLIWLDGSLVKPEDAKISILSPTTMYGLNVFETIRGYRTADNMTALFRARDHVERLMQSCRILDVSYSGSVDVVLDAIQETLEACCFEDDVSMRVVLFFDDEGGWSSTSEARLMIAPIAKGRAYTDPISCCISSWERIKDNSAPPRAKVGANYVSGRLSQLEAKRNGFDMPLLLNSRGTISEAPGACFFIVRDGVLVTPPGHASILESITRLSIFEIADDLNIGVQVREIDRTEVYCANEAFVCGTAVEITPVRAIDHCEISVGDQAPVTSAISSRYFDIARAKVDEKKDLLIIC